MRRWLGVLGLILAGLLTWGCALNFSARLLAPWNREVKPEAGDAHLFLAKALLEAGLSGAEVVVALGGRGVPEAEARALVVVAQGLCKCGGEK